MIDRSVFPEDPVLIARGDVKHHAKRRIVYELMQDFRVSGDIIPFGFLTDGASIPWPAYSIAGGPYSDTYIYAALWHDWYYCVHASDWTNKLWHTRKNPRAWAKAEKDRLKPMTREQVDRKFKELLLAAGQPKYRAWYFHKAVRANVFCRWRVIPGG